MPHLSRSGLRLLLALDEQFEHLAATAICSFLTHNVQKERIIEQVVVVTPASTRLHQLPTIAAQFEIPFIQYPIPIQASCHRLPDKIKPYFYCIEAIEAVCNGELAKQHGRYLYVDADTLCIRSIAELIQLPLSHEKPLAACSHGRPMADRQLVLDLASPYHYFNAGVMLFDSELLSSAFSASNATQYYEHHKAICRFREQCVLNAILRNRVQYLPSQYNYLSWMRPRVANGPWHHFDTNSMAYCLTHVREELAIVHLSAGAIPDRISPERLEAIDYYWLFLRDSANDRTISFTEYQLMHADSTKASQN